MQPKYNRITPSTQGHTCSLNLWCPISCLHVDVAIRVPAQVSASSLNVVLRGVDDGVSSWQSIMLATIEHAVDTRLIPVGPHCFPKNVKCSKKIQKKYSEYTGTHVLVISVESNALTPHTMCRPRHVTSAQNSEIRWQ